MDTLSPEKTQIFQIPSWIRNRFHLFDSDNFDICRAIELLVKKNAHEGEVSLPAKYIREAEGRRVHEAIMELVEMNVLRRDYYIAPTAHSAAWNHANRNIDIRNEDGNSVTEKSKNAAENLSKGGTKPFHYTFNQEILERSEWVTVSLEKDKDVHHKKWNSLFDDNREEWEKSYSIEASTKLIEDLNNANSPRPHVLALANQRMTFCQKGETLGRKYTTFGIMKSKYRKHFRLNGEPLVELDIGNSVFFHFFGHINKHSKDLVNPHGYWTRDAEKGFDLQKRLLTPPTHPPSHPLTPSHHYDGRKGDTDYRKYTFLDLDPVIRAVSDEGDIDFYEYVQAHMKDIYEHPTREFAKTQMNTWANSKNYFEYEDSNGNTKKNKKREELARKISESLRVGSWTTSMHFGFENMFLNSETGCDMMREEARMMLNNVQPSVEKYINEETLAVHDALYAPKSKVEKTKKKMKEVYKNEYGIAPKITTE